MGKHLVLLSLLVFVFAACQGDNPAPAATPITRELTIIGPEALTTDALETYSAIATRSDGQRQTVAAAWTSSDATVARFTRINVVPGTADLYGERHGAATLTASFEGVVATRQVEVVNRYDGSWRGQFVVTACNDSGGWREVNWCKTHPVGSRQSLEIVMAQTGTRYDEITGTLTIEGLPLADGLRGFLTSDGRLHISGSADLPAWEEGVCCTLIVGGWDTSLTSHRTMDGRFAFRLTGPGDPGTGSAYQENQLVTLTAVVESEF